jgi:hypothetical protein
MVIIPSRTVSVAWGRPKLGLARFRELVRYSPVWPSIDSLMRSAWPLWRAYSSIM